jgi:hypothetical protein
VILDGRYHAVLISSTWTLHNVTVETTSGHVMKTRVIGVRFSSDERAALKIEAQSDDRSMSAMVRKIVVNRLLAAGRLKSKRQKEGARA